MVSEITREGGMGWTLVATRQVGEATMINMAHQFECPKNSNVYMVWLLVENTVLNNCFVRYVGLI